MIDASEFKMTRGNRASREQRSVDITEPMEQNDNKDIFVRDMKNDNYMKSSTTPLQKQWTSSEDLNQPFREIKTSFFREQGNNEDTETELAIKSDDKPRGTEEYSREKVRYPDIHTSEEKVSSRSPGRKKKRSKRRRLGERLHTTDCDHHSRINAGSSIRRYSGEDSFTDKSRRKKNTLRVENEVPITEILKKAQGNERIKYEEPVPLSELTTDTIYIQGKNGFSAVRIGGLRHALGNDIHTTEDGIGSREDRNSAEIRTHTLIRVAIIAQKLWKYTGLVYQGLLGGMALLHFIIIHIFFNTTMEFILNYSIFSEIYTNIFSFLIVLCIISIFDKIDLARLDMDHLREIYTDHMKTAVAVPLYLVTFGLHQASSKFDDQLALMHYYNINETIWSNNTVLEIFLDELKDWQKITISKDLFAVLAWFFVGLGTRDNMLLMHLESMEKYASNMESPR